MIDDSVRAYLIGVLVQGIQLDFDDNSKLPDFASKLIEWCTLEIPDVEFLGDEDGVLCQVHDDAILSLTFVNNHMKFHVFDRDVFQNSEDCNLIVAIVMSTVGFCHSYFGISPMPDNPRPSSPHLCPGSEEEVLHVSDDGFGIT